jgi:N-acyl amino acid synthase of PEP-CTERM/exosortase system
MTDPIRTDDRAEESAAATGSSAMNSAYQERRRRLFKGETRAPIGLLDSDFGSPEHPRFPYIPVGLYLGMLTLARRHSIETLFVLTEPRLAKHLSRLGVKIQQIGGPVEHRGTRIPSMMQVDSIIEGLNFLVRPLYNVILNEINSAYDRRKL